VTTTIPNHLQILAHKNKITEKPIIFGWCVHADEEMGGVSDLEEELSLSL